MSETLEGRDRSRLAEIVAATLLLALAVVGGLMVPRLVSGWAFAMPGTTDAALAPTFFPRVAMLLLGLAALNMALTARLRSRRVPLFDMTARDWRQTAIVLAMIGLYFLGLLAVGFLVASAAFMIGTGLLLGYRRLPRLLLVGLAVPLVTGAAFRFGLNVILPSGLLGVGF